jgi:gamma-glutamylcyclotransferase
MSKIQYLAYGSNMLPRRIELRLGDCETIGTASLGGYSLRFHKRGGDGSGKCDAFHTGDQADTLYGVIYSLSNYQREKLDEFEGPGYVSRNVSVRTRSGILMAYTYVAKEQHVEQGLQPFSWYKSIVVAGARVHGLPAPYIERLATTGARSDPNLERHAHHQAIVDAAVLMPVGGP